MKKKQLSTKKKSWLIGIGSALGIIGITLAIVLPLVLNKPSQKYHFSLDERSFNSQSKTKDLGTVYATVRDNGGNLIENANIQWSYEVTDNDGVIITDHFDFNENHSQNSLAISFKSQYWVSHEKYSLKITTSYEGESQTFNIDIDSLDREFNLVSDAGWQLTPDNRVIRVTAQTIDVDLSSIAWTITYNDVDHSMIAVTDINDGTIIIGKIFTLTNRTNIPSDINMSISAHADDWPLTDPSHSMICSSYTYPELNDITSSNGWSFDPNAATSPISTLTFTSTFVGSVSTPFSFKIFDESKKDITTNLPPWFTKTLNVPMSNSISATISVPSTTQTTQVPDFYIQFYGMATNYSGSKTLISSPMSQLITIVPYADALNLNIDTTTPYKTELNDVGDAVKINAVASGDVDEVAITWTAYNESGQEDKMGCPVTVSGDSIANIIFTLNSDDGDWNGQIVVSAVGEDGEDDQIVAHNVSFNVSQVSTIPITSDFYSIDINGTILGFSTEFLNFSTTPNNAIQFLNNHGVSGRNFVINLNNNKISEKSESFSPNASTNYNINNIYSNVVKLSLNGAIFLSHFNSSNEIASGGDTFANAQFPTLKMIDLKNADFSKGMEAQSSEHCFTGSGTFGGVHAQLLETLDLSNTIFMSEQMGNPFNTDGSVQTAFHTFDSCVFPKLNNLIMDHTIFDCEHTYYGSQIENNNFSAVATFESSDLSGLSTLNLTSVILTSTRDEYLSCVHADSTFWETNFGNLMDLFLPSSASSGSQDIWLDTFNSSIYSDEGTIHNYSSRPYWFNTQWFSNWTWTI